MTVPHVRVPTRVCTRRLFRGRPAVDEELATIEVFRDAQEDIQDRWVRLSIDNEPEEILRYGETFRRQISPGRHRLKAHNTLSKDAIEFDAAPGQTVRIRCHNHFARGGMLMMLTIGFAFIKVRLELVRG
jgi:hypothetical protein